jgi:alkyl sulfatase BDS1-like metallo-beta-lactamase superfamily hydrolase
MRQLVDRSMQILVRGLVATVIGVAPVSFAQERKNLAYEQPAPTISPRLTDHSKKMEQRVYKIADNVYSAVGFALANSIMIVGRDGIIIVDTTESVDSATAILAEFRKITDKPVKAVVYTHNHTDHTMGVKAFASEGDVESRRVDIFAHETLMNTVISNASVIAPILGLRSAYSLASRSNADPKARSTKASARSWLSVSEASSLRPKRSRTHSTSKSQASSCTFSTRQARPTMRL